MALKHHAKRAHNVLKEIAWVIAVLVGLAVIWQHFHQEDIDYHTMMLD